MKRFLLFLLLALPTIVQQTIAQQQVTIRICTYNVLNFGTPTPERASALALVLSRVQPDILALHDIAGGTGYASFISLMPAPYQYAPFTDGFDTDNFLFYNSTKIDLIAYDTIQTTPRITDIWTVVVKGTTDTIHILGCHLKAGTTQSDADERDLAAQRIRVRTGEIAQTYSGRHHFLLAADLNVYSSDEFAYQELSVAGTNEGDLHDPINRPGAWHANSDFAYLHTQSPRLRQFDGGIGGGLVDRFDFVLLSTSLLPYYQPGSYTSFGNDEKHFNDSINRMPNSAVDSVTAQALHDASDHLPVYLDLVFMKGASDVEERRRVPMEMDLSQSRER